MTTPAEEMALEEQFFPTRVALIQRWLPWVRLLRGFRMAIDFRPMWVAFVALFLWSAGDWLLSYQYFSPYPDNFDGPRAVWPWDVNEVSARSPLSLRSVDAAFSPPGQLQVDVSPLRGLRRQDLDRDGRLRMDVNVSLPGVGGYVLGAAKVIFWPLTRVWMNAKGLITGHGFLLSSWYLLSTTLWGVIVSSIFGGAICRIAAVEFAGVSEISSVHGLQFALRHSLSYLGAPLIGIAGLIACWIPNLIAGWIARIPIVGEILVALLWCLPLLAGFVMAIIVLGIAVGWPLMIAGISADAGDAFDGLSRAYSYLFNRPWYLLFLCVLMVLYGSVLLLFVDGMVRLTNELTVVTFRTGYGDLHVKDVPPPGRRTFGPLDQLTGGYTENSNVGSVVKSLRSFWTALLASIPGAFVFSFFWTMMTIIYFLLRLREDATPLNEVAPAESRGPNPMPVVGIPAAELREKTAREQVAGMSDPAAGKSDDSIHSPQDAVQSDSGEGSADASGA